MKVLFAAPVLPWPLDCGGRIRTFKLLRELGGRVELHFRGVRQPDVEAGALHELERCCASVRVFERGAPGLVARVARARRERWFFSSELARALADELERERYDLVHLDEMVLVRALPEGLDVPLVVHHHKLDTQLHERTSARSAARAGFEAFKLARLEAEAARRTPFHVACSALDARELERRYPSLTCGVVPNGFDPSYFRPPASGAAREAGLLLFLGDLSYAPNVEGVVRFVREILPLIRAGRPDVQLEIVGRAPDARVSALAADGVRIVGAVHDVRPHLARAALLVAPLAIGGGTRLKLVDALASACPVVATSAANEGLEFVHGEHLTLADEPADFARAVLALLAEPERATRTAQRGRRLALRRYTWQRLAGELLVEWSRAAQRRGEPAVVGA